MGRGIDISGTPARIFEYLVWSSLPLGILILLGFWGRELLGFFGVSVGFVPSGWWFVALGLGCVVLTRLWVRRLRRSDGQWWGPIPNEQYLGRFAGHGGLARHNWEQAIRQLPGHGDDEDREE